MSWPYESYDYEGHHSSGWYQGNVNPFDFCDPWNQDPHLSEPNLTYTSWPTTHEPIPPYFENFVEPSPLEASEDTYVPPYQSALNEMLAMTEMMAQDVVDLLPLFEETDRIIAKIPGLENFSSQPLPNIVEQTYHTLLLGESYDFENADSSPWPMETESVPSYQSLFQGEPDPVEMSDFGPHNPLCVSPSHDFAYPFLCDSRPDQTVELSVTSPREIGHDFEYRYEGTGGTTHDFQGHQEENQFGGQWGNEFGDQESGFEFLAYQSVPFTIFDSTGPTIDDTTPAAPPSRWIHFSDFLLLNYKKRHK